MIIFDLDGTLADCEHRRHFVDPSKNPEFEYSNYHRTDLEHFPPAYWKNKKTGKKFKPDWRSFYESCSEDKPIHPTMQLLNYLILMDSHIEIWSGRCESVRRKTEEWLKTYTFKNDEYPFVLKMRPMGDSTPDDVLKETWLNERCSDLMQAKIKGTNPVRHNIDFVFDDRPKVVRMWRRRGIFVFNVNQTGEEF